VSTAATQASAAASDASSPRRADATPSHTDAISTSPLGVAIRPIAHVDLLGRDHDGADALVAAADIICCCTTATEPLFDGSLVADHATVVAIGSHDPEARETDDALAGRATVVVESRVSALREAGDVVAAIKSKALAEDTLITLSELVRGATVPDGPRLFKSTGMSWEDAVIAAALT